MRWKNATFGEARGHSAQMPGRFTTSPLFCSQSPYKSHIPLFKQAMALYDAHCLISEQEPSQAHVLDMLVTHFLHVHDRKKALSRHLRILERDGYRCQVPGCSGRRNIHVHHIVFRSRGGSDEDSNLLTLCGIYMAFMRDA